MKHEDSKKRFAGRGYYIALIACIAAVGISGYVFVKTARESAVETVASVSPAAVSQQVEKPSAKAGVTPAPKGPETAADEMEDAYEETMEEMAPVICWPVQGDVIAAFSRDTLTYSQTMADWRTHEGLDIAVELGTPVSVTQDGTVTAVYADDYLGPVVVVSHSGDLATRYANLAEEPNVVVGEHVSAGQTLGQVGDSALLETAEEPHLHFEVFSGGEAMDPMDYLEG